MTLKHAVSSGKIIFANLFTSLRLDIDFDRVSVSFESSESTALFDLIAQNHMKKLSSHRMK